MWFPLIIIFLTREIRHLNFFPFFSGGDPFLPVYGAIPVWRLGYLCCCCSQILTRRHMVMREISLNPKMCLKYGYMAFLRIKISNYYIHYEHIIEINILFSNIIWYNTGSIENCAWIDLMTLSFGSTFKRTSDGTGNDTTSCENLTLRNSDPCWKSSNLDRVSVYRIMVVCILLLFQRIMISFHYYIYLCSTMYGNITL